MCNLLPLLTLLSVLLRYDKRTANFYVLRIIVAVSIYVKNQWKMNKYMIKEIRTISITICILFLHPKYKGYSTHKNIFQQIQYVFWPIARPHTTVNLPALMDVVHSIFLWELLTNCPFVLHFRSNLPPLPSYITETRCINKAAYRQQYIQKLALHYRHNSRLI